MNKTFKVARSLTRGTVVTSEKASSYQGKAVKTVIAAAVALVAGAAMATPAQRDIKIDGTTLTLEGTSGGTAADYKPTDATKITVTESANTANTSNWNSNHSLSSAVDLTLDNDAQLVLTAKGGDLVDVTTATLGGSGVVTLNAANGTAEGEKALNVKYTTGLDNDEGDALTFNFSAGEKAATADQAATVTLSLITGTSGLGALAQNDEDSGASVAVNVAANTKAVVDSADSKIAVANTTFDNKGELQFTKLVDYQSSTDLTAGKFTYAAGLSVTETQSKADVVVDAGDVVLAATAPTGAENYNLITAGGLTLTGSTADAAATLNADSLTATSSNVTVNGFGVLNVAKDAAFKTTGTKLDVKASGAATVAGTATFSEGAVLTNAGTATFGNLTLLQGSNESSGKLAVAGALKVGTAETSAKATTLTISGDATAKDVEIAGIKNDAGNVTVDGVSAVVAFESVTVGNYSTFALTNAKTFTASSLTANGGESAGATVSIAGNGKYVINNLTVGANDTVTMTSGTLDLGSVKVTKAATDDNLTVAGGTVTLGTVEGTGVYKQTAGTLTTDFANVVSKIESKTEGETTTYTVTKNANVEVTGTTLNLTGGDSVYEFDAVKQMKTDLAGNTIKLLDAAIKNGDKNLTTADLTAVDNYAGASTVDYNLTATTASTWTAAGAVVGVLNIVQPEDVTGTVTDAAIENATIRGNGSEFITGVVPTQRLTLSNIKLGEANTKVNGGAYAGVLTFAGSNSIDAGDWTFGDIAGATGTTLAVSGGNLTITGQLTDVKKAGATEDTDTYNVLTIGQATYTTGSGQQAQTVKNYFSGDLTVSDGHYIALGNYSVQAAAVLAELQAEEDARAELDGDTATKVNLIYVGQQTVVNKAPQFAGTGAQYGTVYVDLASVAATAGYDKTQGILVQADTTAAAINGEIIADNVNAAVVTKDETVAGLGTINFGSALAGKVVEYENYFYAKDGADVYTVGTDGVAQIQVNEGNLYSVETLGLNSFKDLEEALYNFSEPTTKIASIIYNNYGDWEEAAWDGYYKKLAASGLYKEGTTLDDILAGKAELAAGVTERDVYKFQSAYLDAFDDSLVNAEHAATNMAALGGAFSASLDAQNEVVGALNRRLSKANVNAVRGEVGVTPWVDVFGTTNEAKRLYGSNAGYEADIYGAVLGFDYTAACGGTLGVAFNIGTGDGNSVGAGQKVENDQDFYGVSLYAAKEFGGFNTMLDLGYMTVENDLSTSSAFFGKTSEKLDADLFTVGLGAEYALDAGVAKVTPHAGIRMTRLSMDDSKYGADYDDMTVYQLPLGVAVSSTFETNGWKLAPMADVSVVPTFGDKDAVATFTGGVTDTVRVVDTNPVQGTLGVEAQNGAFTFGLNYRLTAGGDDRMNNSFNANVRYAF